MKAKIISYAGPNKVVVKNGNKEIYVRLAVNNPHPAVGADVEFAETQIVGDVVEAAGEKVPKSEKKAGEKVPDSEPPKR